MGLGAGVSAGAWAASPVTARSAVSVGPAVSAPQANTAAANKPMSIIAEIAVKSLIFSLSAPVTPSHNRTDDRGPA